MKQKIREEKIEEINTQDFETKSNELLQGIKNAQEYNATINIHQDYYRTFKPTNDVLVRVYRRMPIVTDGEIIVNMPQNADYAEITKTAGSGQKYNVQEVATEFMLSTEAVIVATPNHITWPVGQRVVINQLLTKGSKTPDGITFFEYQGAFVHPASGKTIPPSDCTDVDYGYALIPAGFVKGWNENT